MRGLLVAWGNVEKKKQTQPVWYFVISAHHKYRMVYSDVSLSLLPTPTAENFLVNTCCETFDTVNHAHVLPSHVPPPGHRAERGAVQ